VAHDPTRYLATNHHLAELIQRIYTPDIPLRKTNILLARKHYEDFLKQLDSYDILEASDAKLLEAYNEDKANFSTANTRDAAARRDAKIARFRQEKELKRKLEVRTPVPVCFFPFPLDLKTEAYFSLVSATEP
jgi:immunoglobulin-binding protein 1